MKEIKKAKIIVEDFEKLLSGVIRNDSVRHTAASLCAIYHIENSDAEEKNHMLQVISDRVYVAKKKKRHYNKEMEIDRVLQVVAEEYDLTVDDLKSKCRKRCMVTPRQIAMKILRYNFKYPMSVVEIGKVFNRDHTTVIHSTATIIGYLEVKDSYIYYTHARILSKLK